MMRPILGSENLAVSFGAFRRAAPWSWHHSRDSHNHHRPDRKRRHRRHLTREGLRLVMRSDHPLAHRATITMHDVASCQLVLGNANEWDFFRALIDKPFAKKGLKLNITYEASNTMGILGLVAGGLGQTIYVDSITRIQPEGLVSRSISDCDASITTALAWRRGHQTPIIRNLIAAARANLSAPARLG